MTVCIAALCPTAKAIVAVSDTMLSTGDFSADAVTSKVSVITQRWHVMFSADDIALVPPLIDRIRGEVVSLTGTEEKEPSTDEILRVSARGYQGQLRQEIENTILGRYGLGIDQFLEVGLKCFGGEEFSKMKQKIDDFVLDVDLLGYRFNEDGSPHLFTVSDPGVTRVHDFAGMWAVGSGAWTAIGSLMIGKLFSLPLEEIFYRACAAKFLAENASGVGRATIGYVLYADGQYHILETQDILDIKEIWSNEGRPKPPQAALERTKTAIQNADLVK